MSSELAMNAYVLLGNALHWFANDESGAAGSGLNPTQVRELYGRLEPQRPAEILEALAALTKEERSLLGDVCRYVLTKAAMEANAILGVPTEVAEQTLAELGI